MIKIAITTSSFGKEDATPIEMLQNKNINIILNPHGRKLERVEVAELCKDAVGIIAGTECLDADVLQNISHIKVISRCGTGLDNVDLKAAAKLGIRVFNTPDAPTLPVAELTLGFMLDLMRKVSRMDRDIRNNQWKKRMGNLLTDKKIGIVGLGRIGKKVAELLKPFNCEVYYADLHVGESSCGKKCMSLEELLGIVDIVTIHVPVSETLISASEIALMKKGSWLINASRGGVVNEQALYEALSSGHLAGAALDVYSHEPYVGPLRELDSVILTPHIGSYALEARINMESQAVANLLIGLQE